jgi:hypothetical protein
MASCAMYCAVVLCCAVLACLTECCCFASRLRLDRSDTIYLPALAALGRVRSQELLWDCTIGQIAVRVAATAQQGLRC